MAYVVVLGFEGSDASLGQSEQPLNFLAHAMGYGALGTLINVGILISFFSCTLASINSTARIVFAMARHGLFYDALGESHKTNETPYLAVCLSGLVTFVLPAGAYLSGVSAFDAQGYFGTLCSFGFLVVYILISVAAPLYLRQIGKLTKSAIGFGIAGAVFMLLPFLGTIGFPGSALFPVPQYPDNILPAVFLIYMAVGFIWLLVQKTRRPKMMTTMTDAIEKLDIEYANERIAS
jgi:amino acid transporter